MKENMFTAEMIAPCGLDCSLCKRALSETDPCPGCLGPDKNKPEFCSEKCGIILCRKSCPMPCGRNRRWPHVPVCSS